MLENAQNNDQQEAIQQIQQNSNEKIYLQVLQLTKRKDLKIKYKDFWNK